jgi:hypothetical protein
MREGSRLKASTLFFYWKKSALTAMRHLIRLVLRATPASVMIVPVKTRGNPQTVHKRLISHGGTRAAGLGILLRCHPSVALRVETESYAHLEGISELLFAIRHPPHMCRGGAYLLDAPHQLPQIAALDPLLFSATAYPEPSASRASAADSPALADFANDPRRLAADHGASCNHHVRGHDGVREDLDVLFDHCEGVDGDIVADVDVR